MTVRRAGMTIGGPRMTVRRGDDDSGRGGPTYREDAGAGSFRGPGFGEAKQGYRAFWGLLPLTVALLATGDGDLY